MQVAAPRRGRPPRMSICGRRHCTRCKRWRHIHDFKVRVWADKRQTVPRLLRSWCDTCEHQYGRSWKKRYYKNRRDAHEPEHVVKARIEKREQEQQRRRELFEELKTKSLLENLPREDRFSYQLEGGIPLPTITGGWSLSDEDYDPTPVPQGCPSCFLRGGHPCVTCPDADVKTKVREAKAQGLILKAI